MSKKSSLFTSDLTCAYTFSSLHEEPEIVVNSLKLVTSVLVIPSNLILSPVDAKFIYLYDQILSVKNKSA